jgi:hypothetical protein
MKKVILIVLALPVLAWGVLWIFATSMQHSVSARPWPKDLGSLDSFAARYPDRAAATSAALELTKMTEPLGVDIAPREERKPVVPAPPERKSYAAVKRPLHDYIDAQLDRPSAAIDDAPPAVVAYFDAHRAQLDAVRAHILSGAPIAWKVQLSKGFDWPIPNLLGHVELTRLFAADALMKTKSGDAGAWDDLHAIWQLDAGLRSRPDLLSHLIAIATTRMMNAAAAKLPPPEPAWLAEVRAFDYRRAAIASMQSEAYTWVHVPDSIGLRPLARPYIRISGADTAERMRTAFIGLAKSNACDVGVEPVTRSIPRWNFIGKIAIPNISSIWQRTTLMTPETELTEKVLQLRGGRTPSSSSRCSDGQWVVTPASVKFSRTLRGSKRPLEFAALDLGH